MNKSFGSGFCKLLPRLGTRPTRCQVRDQEAEVRNAKSARTQNKPMRCIALLACFWCLLVLVKCLQVCLSM